MIIISTMKCENWRNYEFIWLSVYEGISMFSVSEWMLKGGMWVGSSERDQDFMSGSIDLQSKSVH